MLLDVKETDGFWDMDFFIGYVVLLWSFHWIWKLAFGWIGLVFFGFGLVLSDLDWFSLDMDSDVLCF
jgi:hypothetical protein